MHRFDLLARATLALALTAPTALSFQVEQQKLIDPAGSLDDRYGGASDIDGDLCVVGAAKKGGSGAAFVYRFIGASWVLDEELASSDALASQWFGGSVAISGEILVVGARHDPQNGLNAGAAYVFEYDGASWVEVAKLTPSDPFDLDWFGHDVAIEADVILVGAPFKNAGAGGEGAAYVFMRNGAGVWSEQAKLEPSDPGADDLFGWAVAVSGGRAVIGSKLEDPTSNDDGSAYVFLRTGSTWAQEAKIWATDADDDDQFGTAVDIVGDTILVGALLDEDLGVGAGAAYVFNRSGSAWNQTQKLTASDGGADDLFGADLALDVDRAVIGAFHSSSTNPGTGAAYVFELDAGAWSEDAKLVGSDSMDEDWFGSSVGLDATRTILGAQSDDGMGSAYVFGFGDPVGGYCFGDGSAAACPCGNESTPGEGQGCANSTGEGGRVDVTGTSSVGLDDLGFVASNLVPNQPGLLFVGENAIAGGAGAIFGDGLRCAGMNVIRLGTMTPDTNGDASWGPGLGAQGGWSPGDTRYFQVWYRDPSGGPCGQTFNLSNGAQVDFVN